MSNVTSVILYNLETHTSTEFDGIFKNEINIESDNHTVAIALVTNDENDERFIHFELNSIQCQILADVLLRMSKHIKDESLH